MIYKKRINIVFHNIRLLMRLILIVASAFVASIAYARDQAPASGQTIQVKAKSSVSRLFYNGSLSPLTVGIVQSPVDGQVIKMFFSYGQEIKKGQNLFALSSDKLSEDYRASIHNYFQKKQAVSKAKQNAKTDGVLYQAGATPRDTYEESKTAYENSKLELMQSRQKLVKVLAQAKIDMAEVESLTIHDTDKVKLLLGRQFTHILIASPAQGVALFPQSDEVGGGASASQTQLAPGSTIKKGQLLLGIGDLSGLSTTIQVSEINIGRVHVGQRVLVTGNAFPGVVLHGAVSAVAVQANQSNRYGGSGLSMFTVKLQIPKITPQQAKIIHVGMTAKIEMPLKNEARINIPIAAVTTRDGLHYVTVVGGQGTRSQAQVITGTTTEDGHVAILKGLVDGETIVVPTPGLNNSSGH